MANCVECDYWNVVGRGLCNTCYVRNKRQGTLWQFVATREFDTRTERGQHNLEWLIRWVYEFNFSELEVGLSEYVDGAPYQAFQAVELNKFQRRPGYVPYPVPDKTVGCFDCGENGENLTRGLCQQCYTQSISTQTEHLYPTKGYATNPEGHIYWLLNNHINIVIDIGQEFGVEIVRLEDSESRSSETL